MVARSSICADNVSAIAMMIDTLNIPHKRSSVLSIDLKGENLKKEDVRSVIFIDSRSNDCLYVLVTSILGHRCSVLMGTMASSLRTYLRIAIVSSQLSMSKTYCICILKFIKCLCHEWLAERVPNRFVESFAHKAYIPTCIS